MATVIQLYSPRDDNVLEIKMSNVEKKIHNYSLGTYSYLQCIWNAVYFPGFPSQPQKEDHLSFFSDGSLFRIETCKCLTKHGNITRNGHECKYNKC